MRFPTLSNFNLKNKSLVLVAIFTLINIGIIYFLIMPSIDNIKNLRNDTINLKIDSENKIAQETKTNDLNNKLKKIEPQLEKINQIFISQNREIEFITTLESLESKYNITQTLNLGLDDAEQGDGFKIVPFSIDANGNFKDIMNYLTGVESLNYYINIENISLSNNSTDISSPEKIPGQESDADSKVNIKISGFAYWK
jgi:Tfp pilus assembly protein PilO